MGRRKLGQDAEVASPVEPTGSRGLNTLPVDVEIVDKEVLKAMPNELRHRLTMVSHDRMTLRQMHNAGGAYLATLACHPLIRQRVVESALANPLTFLKIASSERPKESLVEVDTHKTVVVLPAQVGPGEWDRQAKNLLISEHNGDGDAEALPPWKTGQESMYD